MNTISTTVGSPEPVTASSTFLKGQSTDAPQTSGAGAREGGPLKVTVQSVQPAPDPEPLQPPPLPLTAGLSPAQETALSVLASGAGPAAAARAAGVVFSTVHRWRKNDANFIAALNAWRNHAQESARDRVLAMAVDATTIVHGAIRKGDVKIAIAILDKLGAIVPAPNGPESLQQVKDILHPNPGSHR